MQFADVFPTLADRRADLLPEALERAAPGGLYSYRPLAPHDEYPLALISPSTSKAISSSLYQLVRDTVPVELHPDDAARRCIAEGDLVRVFNGSGEVHCRARLSGELRAGVAVLPKGLWGKHTINGQTANALAPDTLTDLGGGACFNDARVQIERMTK